VPIGTITVAALVTAALLGTAAGEAGSSASRRCATLVSVPWTRTADGRVTHGRRYRVESERLSCFVVTRLAAQLIPLRTRTAFESARPVGYVCIALGAGLNPYRPRTAVGTCFQKPVASPPPRSFSWRPVP
jgi:hypothetical protein